MNRPMLMVLIALLFAALSSQCTALPEPRPGDYGLPERVNDEGDFALLHKQEKDMAPGQKTSILLHWLKRELDEPFQTPSVIWYETSDGQLVPHGPEDMELIRQSQVGISQRRQIYMITRLGRSDDLQDLINITKDKEADPRIKDAVSMALASMGDRSQAQHLIRILKDHSEWRYREHAAELLRFMDSTKEVISALEEAAEKDESTSLAGFGRPGDLVIYPVREKAENSLLVMKLPDFKVYREGMVTKFEERLRSAQEGIVFSGEKGAIYLGVPKADGVETTRLSPEGASVMGEVVSPSGRVVMVLGKGSAIPEGEEGKWITKAGIQTRLLRITEKGHLGSSGVLELVVPSPDGRFLYYSTVSLSDGVNTLRSEDLDTGESRAFFSTKSRIDHISVSPDGTKIAYFNTGDPLAKEGWGLLRLRVYDIATGKDWQVSPPSLVTRLGGDHKEAILWSPDGSRVFFEARYADDEHLLGSTYEAYTEGTHPVRRICAGTPYSISSDGKTVYITTGRTGTSGIASIWAVRTDTESPEPALLIPEASHPVISPSGRMMVYSTLIPSQLRCRFLDTGADILIRENSLPGLRTTWAVIPVRQ